MGAFRKCDDVNQGLLLPPSVRDWLSPGHLAWFIKDTVGELDIDVVAEKYRVCGKGELAYPPRVMLQLLIYGYCTGTFSSRKIAAQIEDSVAFRVLAEGQKPNHRTICRFREDHLDAFKSLFTQVVHVALEAGLVKMGLIAIDGSKVKADASKHKAMSYDRMLVEEKRLSEEIAKLTDAAKNQDELDDKAFGPDFRGDELPKELSTREERLAKIKEARKRLEERKAAEAEAKQAAGAKAKAEAESKPKAEAKTEGPKVEKEAPKVEKAESTTEAQASKSDKVLPAPRDQENFTDPDSRIMPTGGKSFGQCYNGQIAVDAEQQMVVGNSVIQSTNDNGQLIPMVNAACENTGLVPAKVVADAGYRNEVELAAMSKMGVDAYVALGREGKAAAKPSANKPHTVEMSEKLNTKEGRATYKKRKSLVEPVFGWLKHVLGFRSFSLRGLRKVQGEWNLVCLALNLRRMATMEVAK